MARFTKSQETILKEGTVNYSANQYMGGSGSFDTPTTSGNRITDAAWGVGSNDYITKEQFEDPVEHDHSDLAIGIHGNELHKTSDPNTGYASVGHGDEEHTGYNILDLSGQSRVVGSSSSGYQNLPNGARIQWGRSASINVTDIGCSPVQYTAQTTAISFGYSFSSIKYVYITVENNSAGYGSLAGHPNSVTRVSSLITANIYSFNTSSVTVMWRRNIGSPQYAFTNSSSQNQTLLGLQIWPDYYSDAGFYAGGVSYYFRIRYFAIGNA